MRIRKSTSGLSPIWKDVFSKNSAFWNWVARLELLQDDVWIDAISLCSCFEELYARALKPNLAIDLFSLVLMEEFELVC